MDITLSGGNLKQAITITIGEATPKKDESTPLKKALQLKPKNGTTYIKAATEPYVG